MAPRKVPGIAVRLAMGVHLVPFLDPGSHAIWPCTPGVGSMAWDKEFESSG